MRFTPISNLQCRHFYETLPAIILKVKPDADKRLAMSEHFTKSGISIPLDFLYCSPLEATAAETSVLQPDIRVFHYTIEGAACLADVSSEPSGGSCQYLAIANGGCVWHALR